MIKLIIDIDNRCIAPPARTSMYCVTYCFVMLFVNMSADEEENGLLLNKCVRIIKVIGPQMYMNLFD